MHICIKKFANIKNFSRPFLKISLTPPGTKQARKSSEDTQVADYARFEIFFEKKETYIVEIIQFSQKIYTNILGPNFSDPKAYPAQTFSNRA